MSNRICFEMSMTAEIRSSMMVLADSFDEYASPKGISRPSQANKRKADRLKVDESRLHC